jgi:hypothetical protein
MRTAPFYSVYLGIAVEDLWHDNEACDIVRFMQPGDRRAGQGLLRKHCQYCQLLNRRPALATK